MLKKRWVRAVMALIFFGITYGFASLSIDSGNLIEYAITIFFFAWAIKYALRSIRS